jgi:hypothetical protein
MEIVLGMGALGLLVGTFAAWSASPIAATTLPLLFGLLGGASGFSLVGMDFSKQDTRAKAKLLGLCLAAFSLACIIALVVGIYVRPMLSSTPDMRHNIKLDDKISAEDLVRKIALRRKLEFIGATPSEIEYVLDKTNNSNDEKIRKELNELLKNVQKPKVDYGDTPWSNVPPSRSYGGNPQSLMPAWEPPW